MIDSSTKTIARDNKLHTVLAWVGEWGLDIQPQVEYGGPTEFLHKPPARAVWSRDGVSILKITLRDDGLLDLIAAQYRIEVHIHPVEVAVNGYRREARSRLMAGEVNGYRAFKGVNVADGFYWIDRALRPNQDSCSECNRVAR